MGLMSRLERPRMLLASNSTDMAQLLGTTSLAHTGVWVTADTALGVGAVFSCVRVVAEDVAKLPLNLYRRVERGKEKAVDHPLHWLLHSAPNSVQTDFEWRETIAAHIELRGNAFCYITRFNGEIRELIPINPDLVTVEKDRATFRVKYRVGREMFDRSQILHLRGMSADGLIGLTPIQVHRESLGLAIAVQRHGNMFFRQGARASGVAIHPGVLDDGAHDRLRESIEQEISGENVFKVLLLEEGMSWAQLSLSNDDAQFIETKRASRTEIAGIWRVPPHKIGDLTDATYSNIEAQERAYVQDSLDPRLTRMEKCLNRSLLSEDEQREYFFEFNRDALLKGLTKERYEAFQYALRNGVLSRNEWRASENWNPVDGGDAYYMARDLAVLGADGKPQVAVTPPTP